MTYEQLKLKTFIEQNFDVSGLKQMGMLDKSIRKNYYEKIAARICQFFGYKSIYEYGRTEIKAWLSTDKGCEPYYRPATTQTPVDWPKMGVMKLKDWKLN